MQHAPQSADPQQETPPPHAATPTVERLRHLPLAGTLNVRDVGGYPADGGTTRWGTLLRSDSLHQLDDAGRAHLTRIGLRTVVDLRDPKERESWPSALDGLDLRLHHQPLNDGSSRELRNLPIAQTYQMYIDERGVSLTGAVAALARPGALPGLVHCMAGKDRTGLVVALTLAAVGVADDVIAADYQLSRRYFAGPLIDRLRQRIIDEGTPPAQADDLLDAPAERILATLDHVRARYGGVPAYLTGHGMDDTDLAALHAALIAPEVALEQAPAGPAA